MTQKKYISGHNLRRFFNISEDDMEKIRKDGKNIINVGFYKLYDVEFLKSMFKMRTATIPEHLITSR